jgi:hypothetical protein
MALRPLPDLAERTRPTTTGVPFHRQSDADHRCPAPEWQPVAT